MVKVWFSIFNILKKYIFNFRSAIDVQFPFLFKYITSTRWWRCYQYIYNLEQNGKLNCDEGMHFYILFNILETCILNFRSTKDVQFIFLFPWPQRHIKDIVNIMQSEAKWASCFSTRLKLSLSRMVIERYSQYKCNG